MATHRSLTYAHDESPSAGIDEIRTPPRLVEMFLEAGTEPGDAVFDPFAGFGTTLSVAERLDRIPWGLEFEADRVAHVRDRLATPDHVRQGDILEADLSWVPDAEFVFTSPPFMERTDDRNPFRNYAGESSYDAYLDDIERAFQRVGTVLAAGGRVVVDVVNIKFEGRVTPLAWDVARRVSNVLDFDGEVVVTWESEDGDDEDGVYGYGYDHSYCLEFTNPE